jgi:hypothetical protein
MTIQTNKSINPIIANFAEMSDDSFMRPTDCAEVMCVSIATFWRLVASGQLRTYKLTERTTTIKVRDLRDFIAKKEGQ